MEEEKLDQNINELDLNTLNESSYIVEDNVNSIISVKDSVSNVEENLKRQRKKESEIWKHYKEEKGWICCILCSKKYSPNSSTGTLKTHYLKSHTKPQSNSEDRIEKKISDYFQTNFSQKIANEKLLKWVIRSNQPLSLIEEVEFLEFCSHLNERFTVPCRQTLKKNLEELYLKKKEEIRDKLIKTESLISLTTDGFTSINNEPFFGITGNL